MLSNSNDQYDADGNLQYDGVPDELYTFTYDSDGNRMTADYLLDENSDGVVDETQFATYMYNPDGRLDQYMLDYDWDGDGVADVLYTYNYVHTSDDLIEQIETIAEYYLPMYSAYNFIQVTTYLYTEDGDLLVTEFDGNNDGVLDEVYTNTYNEDGQLTEEQNSNGTFTYSYISCDDLNQSE